ncbi:acetyl-CoA carboxylase biotin carboxyl carrier protein subunit [Streptococcus pseudoporcinus]|uniref:Acetyl-CoA carboxylase biotin carboxyl carrier protein subunit n=1 Tax=Streptococcus pseudoporcinus LQ 940-04 TaxID=875093 RepID=G5K7Q9_9STRE|nr:acetyl-CoA carboxylase biotin carboxyl carrier protein subunit [Streptococcus pseudoporcinus]EFR44902.1 acetyl-CoA carboxylase biotin carboxyl carrier protein subunit [Streptococcus pseudoporcinus SPIN 20026]EHI64669.1 acetyl-CoA carboxylase biotin carboxyl carrier protein subunit [Streptococcus pseudoporcinus LQ 940-04]VEF94089.1 glutaconyl-CoA decarboxylase subunit gamma [Streptococcus pseudoporcinus]
MLRKFKITIDGKEYMVEMEEMGGAVTPAPVAPSPGPAAPVESTTPVAEEKVAPVATPVAPAGADAMASPMPGTILKILVKVGDTVSENQPLMILEAMKMENEIVASQAGTVSAIHVSQGQSVNAGDGLITIN